MSRSVAGVQHTAGGNIGQRHPWCRVCFGFKSVAYGLPALMVDSKMHRFMRTRHNGRIFFKEQ